jgi:SAM-dependent methyltransferase
VTTQIRQNYDRLARAYRDALSDELVHKPLDRWLLGLVAERARGRVLDVGCGPGHVALHLASLGADVVGLDLSPEMIRVARERAPQLTFVEGDLMSPPFERGSFAAVVAMYALVHVPRGGLVAPLVALRGALAPGGLLLLSLHVGDEVLEPSELWGIPTDLAWHLQPFDEILAAVGAAGLEPLERLVRWPYDGAEHGSRRGYVLARRPE